MASKPMKLTCEVKLEDNRTYTVTAQMFDGTQFSLKVREYDFQLNDNFTPSKRVVTGFLYVLQEAEQADRCYITLPSATLQHGHNLVVKKWDVHPRYQNIGDFGGQQKDPKIIRKAEVKKSVEELEDALAQSKSCESAVESDLSTD